MERFVIALLIFYNVCLVVYIFKDKLLPGGGDKQAKARVSDEATSAKSDYSIMGKSKFKMPTSKPDAAKSTPLAATAAEGDDNEQMPATFASQTEVKPSSQVADDDLERTFRDVRSVSLISSYDDDDDDYDGVPNDEYAKGSTFDEIGESMETVNRKDATPEQRRRAGKVFSELEGTILFEKIISELPERRRVILDMIDKLYAEPRDVNQPVKQERVFKPLTTLDEFNIRDYV